MNPTVSPLAMLCFICNAIIVDVNKKYNKISHMGQAEQDFWEVSCNYCRQAGVIIGKYRETAVSHQKDCVAETARRVLKGLQNSSRIKAEDIAQACDGFLKRYNEVIELHATEIFYLPGYVHIDSSAGDELYETISLELLQTYAAYLISLVAGNKERWSEML